MKREYYPVRFYKNIFEIDREIDALRADVRSGTQAGDEEAMARIQRIIVSITNEVASRSALDGARLQECASVSDCLHAASGLEMMESESAVSACTAALSLMDCFDCHECSYAEKMVAVDELKQALQLALLHFGQNARSVMFGLASKSPRRPKELPGLFHLVVELLKRDTAQHISARAFFEMIQEEHPPHRLHNQTTGAIIEVIRDEEEIETSAQHHPNDSSPRKWPSRPLILV